MMVEDRSESAGPAGHVTLRVRGGWVLGYFLVVEGEADFDEGIAPYTEAEWRERDHATAENRYTTAEVLKHLRKLERAS